MVSFRQYVAVVHEEATRKGLQGEGTKPRRENLHRDAMRFWRENEDTVRAWTLSQARDWAQRNVSI